MSDPGLAARLREARVAAGLSQGQVAKKMEMHRPTVTEIEAGRRRVSADEMARLCDLYGISIEWAVKGPTSDMEGNARLLLAARELSKMSQNDLDQLLRLLQSLRSGQ